MHRPEGVEGRKLFNKNSYLWKASCLQRRARFSTLWEEWYFNSIWSVMIKICFYSSPLNMHKSEFLPLNHSRLIFLLISRKSQVIKYSEISIFQSYNIDGTFSLRMWPLNDFVTSYLINGNVFFYSRSQQDKQTCGRQWRWNVPSVLKQKNCL